MKKILFLIIPIVMIYTIFMNGCKSGIRNATDNTGESPDVISEMPENTQTGGMDKNITIRFSWWGSETRHKLTLQVLDLYKASHPNIDFEVEYLSGPDYNTKLASQAATGQMPDVFQTDVGWISTYVDMGLIADMQSYVDDKIIDTTNISTNVLASGKSNDGKLYAIPLALNATSMFYDPAVFASAGYDSIDYNWTWEDYDRIITDVYNKTGVPALPLYYHIPEAMLEVIIRQAGYQMFSDDGTSLGCDAGVIVPLFQRILDLTESDAYVSPDIWSTSKSTEDNGLVLGTASTAYGGSNQLISYASAAGHELALTSIPYSGDIQGSYVKPSMMLSVSEKASDKVKAECADFIDFIINDEDAAKILTDERGVPVNAANREIVAASIDESKKQIFEYVAYIEKNAAAPEGWAPSNADEVYAMLVDLYSSVAFKQLTPEEAANQFVTLANEILSANKTK